MALPKPTKIDYNNVDSITPTEMNNIGENLDALNLNTFGLSEQDARRHDDFFITPPAVDNTFLNSGYRLSNPNGGSISLIREPVGVWRLTVGTTLDDTLSLASGSNSDTDHQSLGAKDHLFMSRIGMGSSGQTDKLIVSGFTDLNSNDTLNIRTSEAGGGVFFRLDAGATAVNLFAVTKTGANQETTTDTLIQINSVLKNLKIIASSLRALFYVDNVLVATHTTNIPTTRIASRTGIRILASGATSFDIDLMQDFVPDGRS